MLTQVANCAAQLLARCHSFGAGITRSACRWRYKREYTPMRSLATCSPYDIVGQAGYSFRVVAVERQNVPRPPCPEHVRWERR